MKIEGNHPPEISERELGGRDPATDVHVAPTARTRTITFVGIGVLGLFLILLAMGVVPRLRNHRELAVAAQKAKNTPPEVYVIRPEPASKADLSLAATTQAIQDAIIYARTSGYLSKRYVDIGDQVTAGERPGPAGQLLPEIESPEIDQQLRQAKAELQQSQKNLDLQKANLDLARVTMARYQAADAERAVAKEAVDQSVSAHRTAQAAVAA